MTRLLRILCLCIVLAVPAAANAQTPSPPNFDTNAAWFTGTVTASAPRLVTNTNQALPQLSILSPLSITGNVAGINFSERYTNSGSVLVSQTATLTNRTLTSAALLRAVLLGRDGVTNTTNWANWSLGLVWYPPEGWSTNQVLGGDVEPELVAFRSLTDGSVAQVVDYDLSGLGLYVDVSHQRGRISYTRTDLRAYAATNWVQIYVSLPAVQLSTNYTMPAFPDPYRVLTGVAITTNAIRTNIFRVGSSTTNQAVRWIGITGGTSVGGLRGVTTTETENPPF